MKMCLKNPIFCDPLCTVSKTIPDFPKMEDGRNRWRRHTMFRLTFPQRYQSHRIVHIRKEGDLPNNAQYAARASGVESRRRRQLVATTYASGSGGLNA